MIYPGCGRGLRLKGNSRLGGTQFHIFWQKVMSELAGLYRDRVTVWTHP